MDVVSVSVVANVHGGSEELTHEEVVESAGVANSNLADLIENFILSLP